MNQKTKRIVLFYETFTYGGLENYMLSVKRMCQEEGLECILVSIQKCDRAGVISLSNDRFLNVRFPLYAYRLSKLLRTLQPAIVHSQSYYSLSLSSLLRMPFGYRSICTIHNPFSMTEKSGFARKLLPNLLTPDVLVGVSQHSLSETLNYFNIRAKSEIVIHNWIDTERFLPCEDKKPHQILFVGRLDPQKNVEMLPQVVKELRHETPELELHVCGDGDLAHIVKDTDGIVYHGRVDDEKIVRLMQESSLLILPTKYEGLPLVLLESLSCGTPVVATPVGGIPEIARSSYGCFVAHDKDFVDIVRKTLKADLDYQRIRKEAVRDFSYQRGKKELSGIYEKLLADSKDRIHSD